MIWVDEAVWGREPLPRGAGSGAAPSGGRR
jgi:hypothetical protein